VQGGLLRVGVTESEPWVRLDGDPPTGVEAALVERFASELDAEVEWVEGSESELIEALHRHELDLVIGGLAADTPWMDKAAVTRPYLATRTVVGVPEGEPVPEEFAGVEVAVEAGDEAAALLQRLEALPLRMPDLAGAPGPAALGEWLLDDYGLVDSGVTLDETKHVMAVPLGENAWQVRLERFLSSNRSLVEDLLEQEGHP
jgi:polar amino acid transport system substrate-binding protein